MIFFCGLDFLQMADKLNSVPANIASAASQLAWKKGGKK